MMGIPPAEAARLTYWQYTAIRHEWNVRHRSPDGADDDIEIPDVEFVRARHAELERLPISGKVH